MADSSNLRAAGLLLLSPAGRVLLLRRTDAGSRWAFPGGKVEEGETPEMAARRETQEETGLAYAGGLPHSLRRVGNGVDFTTFFGSVEEFTPTLSDEHDLFQWVTLDEALATGGLHPGCRVALLAAQGLDELGIARLMRVGELVSPQRYQNLLLIAIRITGTGASFRSSVGPKDADGKPIGLQGEYVWRDPKHYLTDEFLTRCQGLPVIWEHPPKQLNGQEFKERAVGTVMIPYIQGSEVWGIAKIYDEAAAALLETEKLSTSPGVRTSGKTTPTEDGRHMLIEDNPTLLDHVAICEVGVWDKGGPPAGVLNQSTSAGDDVMPDTKVEDKKDEAPKATLDDVMSHLKGLHTKIDSVSERQDRQDARLDAMGEEDKSDADKDEEKKDSDKDEEKKDSDKDEEKKDAAEDKADADKDEKKDDSAAVTDKKDAAKEEEKKDSTTNDSEEKTDMPDRTGGDDIAKRVAALESAAAPLSPEQQREFSTIQARADKAFQAFDSAAPRWLVGETPLAYKKRLLREHLDRSPTWKGTDLEQINDAHTLGVIEAKVYADAIVAARQPMVGGEPRLTRHVETDETGRRIVSYYGDAGVAWDPFKLAARRVTGFNKKFD